MRFYIIITSMILGLSFNSQAQDTETVTISLSNPGQEGTLIASSHRGSMTVEAYDGRDVIVELSTSEKDRDIEKRGRLKKISSGSANAEITEENNIVKIKTGSQSSIDLVVKVPKNFNVNLNTHHDGDVWVKGIDGSSEIGAHHGDVTIEDVASAANVNTHHGEIKATFRAIDASQPMVFTTYHGDVDISIPGSTSFKTKLKTTKGDIYTDFEIDMEAAKNTVKKKDGKTKIEIGGWRHGSVGSGGQEYMLSSYNGDIIIRKN